MEIRYNFLMYLPGIFYPSLYKQHFCYKNIRKYTLLGLNIVRVQKLFIVSQYTMFSLLTDFSASQYIQKI
jgi:hypothetical protein